MILKWFDISHCQQYGFLFLFLLFWSVQTIKITSSKKEIYSRIVYPFDNTSIQNFGCIDVCRSYMFLFLFSIFCIVCLKKSWYKDITNTNMELYILCDLSINWPIELIYFNYIQIYTLHNIYIYILIHYFSGKEPEKKQCRNWNITK